ncbi:MAG: copper homeostasis protein CutC [Bacteroidales bacterium]|nr:copper homeostasis protein CutC [Bacteroidales bacterium]
MNKKFEIEVCVSSIEMALEAEKGGADMIELCSALSQGGLTPFPSLIEMTKEYLNIKTMVMIRPRGGDFYYSDIEFETMKRDILFAKSQSVEGVVFGLLKPNGSVDKERTKELVELARPLKVCFHRAIDMTNDYKKAFNAILESGCDRILTSGGENLAVNGLEMISEIQKQSSERIEIMVGSGVGSENAREIYNKTNVKHFHLSAKTLIQSNMTYRNPKISMGKADQAEEYSMIFTDRHKVRALRDILNSL